MTQQKLEKMCPSEKPTTLDSFIGFVCFVLIFVTAFMSSVALYRTIFPPAIASEELAMTRVCKSKDVDYPHIDWGKNRCIPLRQWINEFEDHIEEENTSCADLEYKAKQYKAALGSEPEWESLMDCRKNPYTYPKDASAALGWNSPYESCTKVIDGFGRTELSCQKVFCKKNPCPPAQ